MNRRKFLAAGAVLGGLSAAGLSGAQEDQKAAKIRAGFLGVAHSHASGKVSLIRESSDFELAGICAETEEIGKRYSSSGIRLLKRDELLRECDVIIVESAVRNHAADAKAALEAGKHVHVEKPPADSLAGFEVLQRLAKEKERLLQVGYMWRFNAGFVKALEAARNGWLGDVYLVRGTMNTLVGGSSRPEWSEFKGGATFEQGCHLIDPLVRLLGRPSKVTPFLKTHGRFDDQLADNCVVVFEFEKATGIITNSTLQPNAFPYRHFELLGTNGTALLKPIEQPVLEIDLAKAAGPYSVGRQTVPLPPYRRYADEFVALAAAIRSGKPLQISAEEEHAVQETVLRASQML